MKGENTPNLYIWKNGFTMFEILVVMTIIAVIAALIVPRIGGTIKAMKIRSAIRACSAVLRYSRSIAITMQKEQKVVFHLNEIEEDHDCYTYNKVRSQPKNQEEESVDDEENSASTSRGVEYQEETKKVCLNEGSLSWRDNPDDLWQEEGEYEILFTPRGFSSGGEIRFRLSENSLAYILKIDFITGRVTSGRDEE